MKIGLLACSSQTGLGYQTRDFYNNIKCDKVLIYDISKLNKMPTDHTWAFQPRVCEGIPSNDDCEWLVDGMDIVFVCETPLNYHLFEYANKKGVKVVQQYNYEFLDYFKNPNLPKPTVLASPSKWGLDVVKSKEWAEVVYWPVPVDTSKIKYRSHEKCETLIHILGRPAAYDRNGTLVFLDLVKKLGKKFKYKLYAQLPEDQKSLLAFESIRAKLKEVHAENENLTVVYNCPENTRMYEEGDILIMPRRYGGLCLPMWEALASGMPVIMTDISPNNTILPENWLCEADIMGTFHTTSEIKIYNASLQDLIEKVDYIADNISEESKEAKKIADNMQWNIQKDAYMRRFKDLLK